MIHFFKSLFWLSVLCFVVALTNQWLWVGDLLVSFSLQHLLANLLLIAIYLIFKQKRYALYAIVLCCIQFFYIYPGNSVSHAQGNDKINILQFNVYYKNTHLDELVKWIENNHNSIDVIFLQEVTPELEQKLEKLKHKFPYHFVCPDKKPIYTKVVYSKIPFSIQAVKFFEHSCQNYFIASFETINNKHFTMYGLHTSAPVANELWEYRDIELQELARVVSLDKTPNKIVVGDLNITPYSTMFKTLIKDTGLRSSSTRLSNNTWPSNFKFNFLMISIDHLLISSSIKISERKVGPDLGSDHLPVMTSIGL